MITAQNRLSTPEIFLGVHGGVKASTVLFNPSVQPLDILHSPLSPNGGLVFRYAEHRVGRKFMKNRGRFQRFTLDSCII